jgi:hypothetical protein
MIVPASMSVDIYKSDNYRGDKLTIVGPKMVDFLNDKDYNGWND